MIHQDSMQSVTVSLVKSGLQRYNFVRSIFHMLSNHEKRFSCKWDDESGFICEKKKQETPTCLLYTILESGESKRPAIYCVHQSESMRRQLRTHAVCSITLRFYFYF